MESDTTTTSPAEASIPSCESCRRRKLKCARQQPSCNNCDRLGVACIYDHEKKKPGFKVGAVESLSRRLDVIEKALSVQQYGQTPNGSNHVDTFRERSLPPDTASQFIQPLASVLNSLTKELHSLTATISVTQKNANTESPAAKRRRAEPEESYTTENLHLGVYPTCASSAFPAPVEWLAAATNEVIDSYFRRIHPWISIIHEPSFRTRIDDNVHRKRLQTVVRSMAVAAFRFCKQSEEHASIAIVEERSARLEREIMLAALGETSVENVQALLILIYVDISQDRVLVAHSLLGVVWKQIESLNLHIEIPNQGQGGGIFEKTCMHPRNASWIESEEWRRIFWNAFMLDRLCAALLGRKPTFLGASTSRRLPVCSSFWYMNQPRSTPYLNICNTWNTGLEDATTSDYSTFAQHISDPGEVAPSGTTSPTSGVGSLAFYVEALESMSLILSHFVSLEVNYGSKSEISRWLTRFKELDLHLLRWKSRLPQQWVDSGVSRRIMPGVMDCAMTAANTTHNTCLILLHEQIAYPDARLSWLQLPSLYSADTCQSAAFEVCATIQKFLEQRVSDYPLSPQLGLCAFVSARSLLAYTRHYGAPLAPEFWRLVQSLDDMARRWQAKPVGGHAQSMSLFSRLAGRLRALQVNYQLDPSQHITLSTPLYEPEHQAREPTTRDWVTLDAMGPYMERAKADLTTTALSDSAKPPFTFEGEALHHDTSPMMNLYDETQSVSVLPWGVPNDVDISDPGLDNESLLAISETLASQDFTNIDRIVTVDNIMLGSFF